jgi:thiamine phosphate synthase YjbQ (UPF0047 family)
MVYQKEIQVRTANHGEMHDLTDAVARVVAESRVLTGIAHVFNVGSTGAIGTIEFEPGLVAHGQLVLGTWQQIFHVECDIKPRQRTVVVTVLGEA